MYNPFMFVLGILALVFAVPLMAIWTEHRRKVLEMQLRLRAERGSDAAPKEQVRELAKQLADLRSTATEYDLSFDSALQRLESRMDLLDERLRRIEESRPAAASDSSNEVRIGVR